MANFVFCDIRYCRRSEKEGEQYENVFIAYFNVNCENVFISYFNVNCLIYG